MLPPFCDTAQKRTDRTAFMSSWGQAAGSTSKQFDVESARRDSNAALRLLEKPKGYPKDTAVKCGSELSERVVPIAPAGKLESVRRLTLREARVLRPFWLGRRGLESIVERRYAKGSLVLVSYAGGREVWTYDRAVPLDLLAPRLAETKTLVVGAARRRSSRPAGALWCAGRLPSVAVVERFATKQEVFGAFGRVERLR